MRGVAGIKRLVILFEFYRKNVLAVLLLLVLMASALFYMAELLGYLGFQTCSLQMMEDLGFEDGVYVMAADGFDQWSENKTPAYDSFTAQNFSAVEYVVNPAYAYARWKGDYLNIVVCDQKFLERFHFADRGDWFTQDVSDPDSPIEVVVGGFEFSGTAVGETLQLEKLPDREGQEEALEEVPVKVIGKDVEPTLNLNMGAAGAHIAAEDVI